MTSSRGVVRDFLFFILPPQVESSEIDQGRSLSFLLSYCVVKHTAAVVYWDYIIIFKNEIVFAVPRCNCHIFRRRIRRVRPIVGVRSDDVVDIRWCCRQRSPANDGHFLQGQEKELPPRQSLVQGVLGTRGKGYVLVQEVSGNLR